MHDELVLLPVRRADPQHVRAQAASAVRGRGELTLGAIARFPIITLDLGMEGGRKVMEAFEAARIKPNIVLSAIDADVVKSYVELGLGIAVLLSVAYEPARDRGLARSRRRPAVRADDAADRAAARKISARLHARLHQPAGAAMEPRRNQIRHAVRASRRLTR